MENSILKQISKFIKNNNITIEGASFRITDDFLNRYSPAFYETIIKYMKLATNYDDNQKIETFLIRFTEDKQVYFEFLGADNHTKVIVIEDFVRYENLPSAKVIKESEFISSIKSKDAENNLKMFKLLSDNFKKRFIKHNSQLITIEKILEHMANDFIAYIYYLEKEKQENIEKIYFTEAESSNSTTKQKLGGSKSDRKNDEIPFEERKKVLDEYKPEREFDAVSKNSSSTYHVKIYKIKDKCKLVIEPKEGTKYTKIVHLSLDSIKCVDIKDIVIDTLQLDRAQTTATPNITRHTHTTLEEYKRLLEYVLNDNNTGISAFTQKNIDDANKKR